MSTLGGPQSLSIISEPCLYSLIGRSRKSEAIIFLHWVNHDVLPTIGNMALWSNGMVEMQFQYISTRLPYQDELRMKQLVKDFGAVFNTTFADDAGKRRPSVPLDTLLDEAKMLQLQQLLNRMITEYTAASLMG